MGIRYIGSKTRIADTILNLVGPPHAGRFIDAFSGTGAVAAEAAARGWAVTINDILPSSVAMSTAAVIGSSDATFSELGGYEKAIEKLNQLEVKPGFIHQEYSPASAEHGPIERRYFTEHNAAHIDTARRALAQWHQEQATTTIENELLLADLMQAANSVANISGTYGCFLKNWTLQSKKEFAIKARDLPDRETDFISKVGEAKKISDTPADTLYLDPPYTKRQYGAYYHILETIYAGDEPSVTGVTGLRPWKDKSSDFCHKRKALPALLEVINSTYSKKVLLSYSNEGHVDQTELIEALSNLGDVTLHQIQSIGRYRPNSRASAKSSTVNEYVIELNRITRLDTFQETKDSDMSYT